MIIIAGEMHINPGKREEAVAALLEMAAATQQEEGCIHYKFYADLLDPHTFIVYEEWDSAEHLQGHFDSAHMQVFRGLMSDLRQSAHIKRFEATPLT